MWMDKVGRGAGVAAVLRDRSEESFGGKRAKATHGSTDGRTTRVVLFQRYGITSISSPHAMYPLSSFHFTDPATDVFVEYAVGCRHGQLEVKSSLANQQANKKGKKQSTSNCLRMLAMQDQRSAFMGQDDSPAYFPMFLCSS